VGGACGTHWKERKLYKVLVGMPKERHHSEDQGVDGSMGSEWILGRLAGGCGLDSTCSEQGPEAGCCEYGDATSGSGAMEFGWLVSWLLSLLQGKTHPEFVETCCVFPTYRITTLPPNLRSTIPRQRTRSMNAP
jgi:hypothetical protein